MDSRRDDLPILLVSFCGIGIHAALTRVLGRRAPPTQAISDSITALCGSKPSKWRCSNILQSFNWRTSQSHCYLRTISQALRLLEEWSLRYAFCFEDDFEHIVLLICISECDWACWQSWSPRDQRCSTVHQHNALFRSNLVRLPWQNLPQSGLPAICERDRYKRKLLYCVDLSDLTLSCRPYYCARQYQGCKHKLSLSRACS